MDDQKIARLYVQAYFWTFLATQTLLVVFGTELQSPRGILNTCFTFLALIPYFGYIHDRIFPTRDLWRIFIGVFALWEVSTYTVFYDHPQTIKFLLFLLMTPLYWGVVLYAWITVEENPEKKSARLERIQKIQKRFRSILAITSAFSLVLLLLTLGMMVAGKLQLLPQ